MELGRPFMKAKAEALRVKWGQERKVEEEDGMTTEGSHAPAHCGDNSIALKPRKGHSEQRTG